jgi:hypothetical protein
MDAQFFFGSTGQGSQFLINAKLWNLNHRGAEQVRFANEMRFTGVSDNHSPQTARPRPLTLPQTLVVFRNHHFLCLILTAHVTQNRGELFVRLRQKLIWRLPVEPLDSICGFSRR